MGVFSTRDIKYVIFTPLVDAWESRVLIHTTLQLGLAALALPSPPRHGLVQWWLLFTIAYRQLCRPGKGVTRSYVSAEALDGNA